MTKFRYQILVALSVVATLTNGAQLNVAVQSDMSQPTFGLHQPTSGHITYNNRDGINVDGDLSYMLGPPIKIAHGLKSLLNGGNMAGIGQSLRGSGAMLGVDAKLLEAAGGTRLLTGGLLAGSTAATKTGVAETVAGSPGRKIASVVELPVKVIAMKDLLSGRTLLEAGRAESNRAAQEVTKGDKMIQEGNTLKSQGLTQIKQGAQEGLQNLGNAVQQTTGNAATALKLLPIMLDMNGTHSQHQQDFKGSSSSQQQQQHLSEHQMHQSSGLTGPSLFGGLKNALFPAMNGVDPILTALNGGADNNGLHKPASLANLFGGSNQQHHGYAAVLNANNPLTNLLSSLNPFLVPINSALDPMSNPMASAFALGTQQQSTQKGN